jgi:hypothetical protein
LRSTIVHVLAVAAVLQGTAFAQSIPTATLTGRVADQTGGVLPGTVVTVRSAALQGSRTATAAATGDYILSLLPPGDYEIRFELAGFQASAARFTLRPGIASRLDVTMEVSRPDVEVLALGERPRDVLQTPQIATSYKSDLVEKLPIGRTIAQVALLAGGVADSGPNNAMRISGGPSFENLFLVNGVVVNENLRGQPHDLFIEDAIQETTVMTGNISAEFGRFTGGVVNVVTKSGGNRLSGSYRTSFTNDDWLATTPFKETKVDDVNLVHEATLGGPLAKDRLWFFGAARLAGTSDGRETRPTLRPGDIDPKPIPYTHERNTRRLEGKLTGAINADHRLVASFIDIGDEEVNAAFSQNILDLASLVTRQIPNRLFALNYTGVLSPRVFLEAQYSRKTFAIENGGSPFTDIVKGTLLVDQSRSSARFNSPTFSNDTAEQRDNDTAAVKASYFLPTTRLGAHDIRVGYEHFAEARRANNYQSGSDYRILATGAIVRGEQVFPVFGAGGTTVIQYNPIAERTQGSDLAMHSAFVNDKVTLGRHWSLNAGLRFDKNDAKDSQGAVAARDAGLSPRLSASYDVRGDGKLTLTAGFSKYVAKIAEGPAISGSPAGNSAEYRWLYQGPPINADVNLPTAQLVPSDQAIQRVFDWFNANGGVGRRPFERAPVIPGLSETLEGTLSSPNVKEVTLGAGFALGTRGYVRADLVHRDWDDFYASHVDGGTGQTPANDLGQRFDLSLVHNSEYFDRKYTGVQAHLRYRVTDALQVGGNYTWSRLTGNHVGENVVSGPVTGQGRGYTSPLYDDSYEKYPEYRQESWNNPSGVLPGDQPHRARLWAGYDVKTPLGNLNLSVLESLDSGLPYEAIGNIDPSPYVTNPGYLSPPANRNYFFTEPGAFRTDFITRTDIALNYSLKKFRSVELFAQPELLNVFNAHGIVLGRGDALGTGASLGIDTGVLTRKTTTGFLPFNPFVDKPVRGARDTANPTAHYDLSPTFGQPTSKNGYQLPRAFRVSVGVRF